MTSANQITLTKHHGLGNDFLISIAPEVAVSPVDAIALCDRRLGVGADGLIVSERLADDNSIWAMQLWNADGSRAEISGNGIRCLAQAIGQHLAEQSGAEQTAAPTPSTFTIRTDGGMRTVEISDDRRSATKQVRVDMGAAKPGPSISQRWSEVGIRVENQIGVDMGNPHLVVHVSEPSAIDVAKVGPIIEADYPDGVNVHFASVLDEQTIAMRSWERGAGITQACGSGACAAVSSFKKWGLIGRAADVHMPGGSAHVEVADKTIFLAGPTTYVATIITPR